MHRKGGYLKNLEERCPSPARKREVWFLLVVIHGSHLPSRERTARLRLPSLHAARRGLHLVLGWLIQRRFPCSFDWSLALSLFPETLQELRKREPDRPSPGTVFVLLVCKCRHERKPG